MQLALLDSKREMRVLGNLCLRWGAEMCVPSSSPSWWELLQLLHRCSHTVPEEALTGMPAQLSRTSEGSPGIRTCAGWSGPEHCRRPTLNGSINTSQRGQRAPPMSPQNISSQLLSTRSIHLESQRLSTATSAEPLLPLTKVRGLLWKHLCRFLSQSRFPPTLQKAYHIQLQQLFPAQD